MKYSAIFTEKKLRLKSYIISGWSGAGKTILTQKLIYDGETLAEYIEMSYVPDEEKGRVSEIEELLTSENTLLVIDGLDELKKRNNNHEIIRVIHRYKYKSLSVFVTTRPHVLKELVLPEGKTYHEINIQPFAEEEVFKYIQMYFQIHLPKVKVNDIHDYIGLLNSKFVDLSYFEKFGPRTDVKKIESAFHLFKAIAEKNLWEIVANPQCCLLVCYIWEHKGSLPRKRTLLYRELLFILENTYNTVKKHDLPWHEVIKGLGIVAFKTLLEEKEGNLIFSSNFIDEFVKSEVACKSGLIVEIGSLTAITALKEQSELLTKVPTLKWYQFVHKSIQEFCAAYYLGSLNSTDSGAALSEITSFINKHETVSTLHNLGLFLSGLSSTSENSQEVGNQLIGIFESFLIENEVEFNQKRKDHEHQLNCWKESHDGFTYGIPITGFKTIRLYSSQVYFTISTLDQIYQFLKANASVELEAENLFLGGVEMALQKFELENEVILDRLIQQRRELENPLWFLREIIARCKSLKSLSLLFSDIDRGDIEYIDGITNDIENFDLMSWKISPQTVHSLLECLPRWKHLKQFSLISVGSRIPYDKLGGLMPLSLTQLEIQDHQLTESDIVALIINIPRLELLLEMIISNQNHENEIIDEERLMKVIDEKLTVYKGRRIALKKLQFVSQMNVLPPVVFRALSKVIAIADSLKSLFMSGTNISENGVLLADSIRPSIEELHVDSCELSLNSLTAVVTNLPRWKHVKQVTISYNQQTMDMKPQILNPDISPQYISLESLDMSHCNAKPNLISYLASKLNSARQLRELNLSGNDIQSAGVALSHSIPNSIRTLKLQGSNMSANSIYSILKQLFKLGNLNFLDLSNNPVIEDPEVIGQEGSKINSENNKDVLLNIEHLNFQNNNAKVENWPILSSVIGASMYLMELDLSGNDLSGVTEVKLFNVISPAIEKLSLKNCKLSDREFALLVNNIVRWKRLTFLDISDNRITSSDKMLAVSVPMKIKELRIHNNQFTSEEIVDIIVNLPMYKQLEILHIDISASDDLAFESLCTVISQCKKLKKYEVYGISEQMKQILKAKFYGLS